jgi:predicted nucleic acid-binding protein
MKSVLIDASALISFYSASEPHHKFMVKFFSHFKGKLITTEPCVTETLWLLNQDRRVQRSFLSHLALGIYRCEPLIASDYQRIAVLNEKYKDVPADFADLTLIVTSEKLRIAQIVSLDSDFDIYRRADKLTFERIKPDQMK